MISYRSAEEWQIRFGRERSSDNTDTDNLFGINFEVESYLQNHAERFIGAFGRELLPVFVTGDGFV